MRKCFSLYMAAEDEFRANALHLFFSGFAVYPSVFANAADIILIIYIMLSLMPLFDSSNDILSQLDSLKKTLKM